MRNIKLTLEYDGTNYWGWQKQKDKITIQDILEETIKKILNEDIKLIGASRTDKGVHALKQVANFKTQKKIPTQCLKQAINSLLPKDIYILDVQEVDINFHARFSAKARKYKYTILNSQNFSVFNRNYCLHLPKEVDLDKLQEACKLFIGYHNFYCFSTNKREIERNPYREIYELFVEKKDDILEIYIVGNGFLPHMIRTICGALIEIAKGKLKKEDIIEAFEGKKELTRYALLANGLFLVDIYY